MRRFRKGRAVAHSPNVFRDPRELRDAVIRTLGGHGNGGCRGDHDGSSDK
jgi:hypothetical protein